MNDNIKRFGYEDTDKKIEIEIYGLRFTINTKNILEKDIKDIEKDNKETLLKEIDDLLGANAVNKINAKRNKDGYEDMNIDVQLAILGCIYETYVNATTRNIVDGMIKVYNKTTNEFNNLGNREQRRYNNRKYNKSNRYRGYGR